MAENLAIKRSPVDHILECPLCLHQLTLPQTLQQCLHSYCKSCLDKVPQKTQDGRQGWLCPMCENFTKCDQVQHNTFIEELQKIHCEPEHGDDIKCEQCSEDCGLALWKCEDCKIGLCESAKIAHLRIPMLKGHKVVPLDSDGEKLIDNIVFCKTHVDIPVQLNCRDCDQLICYTCNIAVHEHHKAETVEQALERILPETERSARQVVEKIDSIEAQIKGVKKQIEQTRESYASCRMQMDDHLEKVICQMRAMKSQMEEDVNEQESIALDLLKDIKQQLEKQLFEARFITNLTAVVTTKTRHTSQLQQLQTGLFEKVKAIGSSKKEEINFELPEGKFIEGHKIKEELENVFGVLRFDLTGTNISSSGEVWVNKDDNFLCHDFEAVKLAEGKFSDVVVQQRSFFALEYDRGYIEKYSWTKEGQWQCIYKHKLVADQPKNFKLDTNSSLCVSGDHFLVNSSSNEELYRFNDEGKYLQMFKKANVDPAFCQIDDKGKALIANFGCGNFHLLDTKKRDEITVKEIWKSVTVKLVCDAVFDRSNNDLWIISGVDTKLLTKYTQNKPI